MLTLYETAYAGFMADQDISEHLLAIDAEYEGWWIEQIIAGLRRLLSRDDLTPKQTASIAKLLLGLKRLPLITPGLDVLLSFDVYAEDETASFEIGLSADKFYVSSGGVIRGPMGSDSYSGTTVWIEGRFHSENHLLDVDWLNGLEGWIGELSISIQDDSDDALLDWDHPDGSVFWKALMGDVW